MEEVLMLWEDRINSGVRSRKDLIEDLKKYNRANSNELLIHGLQQHHGRL